LSRGGLPAFRALRYCTTDINRGPCLREPRHDRGSPVPVLPEEMRFEVIVVDDYSPDDVWKVVSEIATDKSWLKGVRHRRNYGQDAALMTGGRDAADGYSGRASRSISQPLGLMGMTISSTPISLL
jgi:hypothetical protein